jgi:hypothetical protein
MGIRSHATVPSVSDPCPSAGFGRASWWRRSVRSCVAVGEAVPNASRTATTDRAAVGVMPAAVSLPVKHREHSPPGRTVPPHAQRPPTRAAPVSVRAMAACRSADRTRASLAAWAGVGVQPRDAPAGVSGQRPMRAAEIWLSVLRRSAAAAPVGVGPPRSAPTARFPAPRCSPSIACGARPIVVGSGDVAASRTTTLAVGVCCGGSPMFTTPMFTSFSPGATPVNATPNALAPAPRLVRATGFLSRLRRHSRQNSALHCQ